MDTIEKNCDIHIENIAIFQGSRIGDAVADDFVHRGADGFGITVIVEGAGEAAFIDVGLVGDGVEFVGGDAGLGGGEGFIEHAAGGLSGGAHALDGLGVFDQRLVRLSLGLPLTA